MDFKKIEETKKIGLLRQIGKMYRNCETKLQVEDSFLVSEHKALYKSVEVKGRVDLALKRLNPTQALIIEKEFLNTCRENWHLEYFYENSYESAKRDAINTFLHCLYG